MRSTTIVLVRHGHVEGIDQPRFRGRMHLQLTSVGLQQAEQASEYIGRIAPHPRAIYSSPLTRCVTTGAIIGRHSGLAPIPEEGLIDFDYGVWQGRLIADVKHDSPDAVLQWFKEPDRAVIPSGETLQAMSERVVKTLAEIVQKGAGEAVVIVGHDSVNRAILLHALGLPLNRYWHLRQDPGAVSRLEFEDEDWRICSLNESAHLVPTLGHAG